MSAVLTPSSDAVFSAVKAFLMTALALPSAQVIKGLQNRVSAPLGGSTALTYVVVTPLWEARLRTNVDGWDTGNPLPTASTFEQGIEVALQFDVFGAGAADQAAIITTLWRDDYACQALGISCQPLYCDAPRLMPQVDGEAQYETRYAITAYLQWNPTVTAPQDFAGSLGPAGLYNVDETYPP